MILAFTGAGISKASGIDTFTEHPEIRDQLHRKFASEHPEEYKKTVKNLFDVVSHATPNDAHYALKEFGVDIITMNIDGLHERVGSQTLALHGSLPSAEELTYADQLFNKPVLYGDPAPNYQKAYQKVDRLKTGDVFLVIGASRYTAVANDLREIAYMNGAQVIEIQGDAEIEVRDRLERLQELNKL